MKSATDAKVPTTHAKVPTTHAKVPNTRAQMATHQIQLTCRPRPRVVAAPLDVVQPKQRQFVRP
jgi:hypothetical protein